MNNLQSILGGISKGLHANKTPQITKESTQSPALNWDKESPGTVIPYEKPIPTNIGADDPYEMQPTNGKHWLGYFANRILNKGSAVYIPNPANVATAVAQSQHIVTDGHPDPWQKHYQLMQIMSKNYQPLRTRGD